MEKFDAQFLPFVFFSRKYLVPVVLLIRDLLADAVEAAVRYLEHSAQLATIVFLVSFTTHGLEHPFFDVWYFLEKVQLVAILLIVHTNVEHFDQDP